MSKYNLLELKFQNSLIFFFKEIGKLENYFTKKIKIKNPTFVFGSPRSGTSLITEVLSKTQYYSSPYQKDLPFCTVPIFWSKFSNVYYGKKNELRVHNPKLILDKNSSDSYEEYIWKTYYDNYSNFFNNLLDENSVLEINPEYLKSFIKKIIFLRKKNFYLSKNNMNILRVRYLNKVFQDAKFIYCVRNPLFTVRSQYKIHKLFDEIKDRKKVIEYLKMLGHYEFSESFETLKVEGYEKVNSLRKSGKYLDCYLSQWINVNKIVLSDYLKDKKIRNKIFLLNFDDLNNKDLKIKTLKNLSNFLEIPIEQILEQFNFIFKRNKTKIGNKNEIDEIKNLNLAFEIYNNIVSKNYENKN